MASAAIGQVHRNIEFIRVLTFIQQTMEGRTIRINRAIKDAIR